MSLVYILILISKLTEIIMLYMDDSNIINDFILEQRIEIDKLIISYTKLKLVIINEKLEIIHEKIAI